MKADSTRKPRRTKILATLGPASSHAQVLQRMLMAGMDGARLNMSHGTHAEHQARVRTLRQVSRAGGHQVALVLDLQGPKIRTVGRVPGGSLQLPTGGQVALVGQSLVASPQRLGIGLRSLARFLTPGMRVLLDDGKLVLRVKRIRRGEVLCDVESGGRLLPRRGVSFPDAVLERPPITAKDRRDLEFGASLGVDFVAQSFVSRATDVVALRRQLTRLGLQVPIIAKLERRLALQNLDEILEVADGVMVARGDLGVEIPLEQVPRAQKQIIASAGEAGRLCITATQMLETMIENENPTRAEVSDVANAVFDGTDVVMLSGETAVGRWPARSVAVMGRIAAAAENPPRETHWRVAAHADRRSILARAAAEVARETAARALVTMTQSGATALRASKHRPSTPILAVTSLAATLRRASLYWGVTAVQHPFVANSDRLRRSVERLLLQKRFLARTDLVVYLGGSQPGDVATHFVQLRRVGDRTR